MTIELADGPEDAAALSPASLLRHAQRLRAAADELETRAAAWTRQAAVERRSWAQVVHGDWPSLLAEATRVDASGASPRRDLGDAAAVQALLAALTGDEAAARTNAVRAETFAPGDVAVAVGVSLARAVTWLAHGDASAAYATTAELFQRHPEAAGRAGAQGLLAETAVLAHRTAAAAAIVRCNPPARDADDAVTAEFELATTLLGSRPVDDTIGAALEGGAVRLPFVRARLQLALGMWLRRHHSTSDAIRHLEVALDHFRAREARPWIRAAMSEMRAGGVRQPSTGEQHLSDQQLRIAVLAARGLSNREIAGQLYLSPRTVGSHLYRIFPKLGISSRHQLANELSALLRQARSSGA